MKNINMARILINKKSHYLLGECSDPKKLDFYGVEKSTPFLYDKINC